jgi:hypothetical protein
VSKEKKPESLPPVPSSTGISGKEAESLSPVPSSAGITGPTNNVFPATVAKVIDEFKVVINRGSLHGLKYGQRLQVYGLTGEEIIDPVTKKSLGKLENAKGVGIVMHTQEELSILESTRTEFDAQARVDVLTWLNPKRLMKPAGFDNPQVGDLAKPV